MSLRSLFSKALFSVVVAGLTLSVSNYAYAQHHHHGGDIGVKLDAGSLKVGAVDENDNFTDQKVFESEFEDVAGFVTTEDPGFDGEAGTFPYPSSIGFNFVAPLSVWTGAGFAPTAHTITAFHTDTNQSATTGAGSVPGFSVDVAPNGEWHEHFSFFLNSPDSNPPANGIYLLQMDLFHSDNSIGNSGTFAIVFNWGMSEEGHEAAVDYVNANIVPEPSALVALGSGMVALLGLKRRR